MHSGYMEQSQRSRISGGSDRNYRAIAKSAPQYLNEYITILQDLTSRAKPQGFTYYSAPSWFVQGLEAYDG
jgi:hypothetical protein